MGVLRRQRHIPSENWPKYLASPYLKKHSTFSRTRKSLIDVQWKLKTDLNFIQHALNDVAPNIWFNKVLNACWSKSSCLVSYLVEQFFTTSRHSSLSFIRAGKSFNWMFRSLVMLSKKLNGLLPLLGHWGLRSSSLRNQRCWVNAWCTSKRVYVPSRFSWTRFVMLQVSEPYKRMLSTQALKKAILVLTEMLDCHIWGSLLHADHAWAALAFNNKPALADASSKDTRSCCASWRVNDVNAMSSA